MELSSAITASTERKDGAEAILVDFSDGLEALMAVPVWFLSTWLRIVFKLKNFISRADRFELQTQINGCLLPALGFLERAREINHNRYSWNRKK